MNLYSHKRNTIYIVEKKDNKGKIQKYLLPFQKRKGKKRKERKTYRRYGMM
jgi:hypothetical protein